MKRRKRKGCKRYQQQVLSLVLQCTRCKSEWPATLDFFRINPKKRNGFDSWCKECGREIARNQQARRRQDPVERLRLLAQKRRYNQSERGREWKRRQSQIDNQRRQERTSSIPWSWSVGLWEQCKRDWDGRCAYCYRRGELTQDHFIPVSDPACPGTVPYNMVPACPSCNYSKQNRSARVWCHDPEIINLIEAYLHTVKHGLRRYWEPMW